MIFRNVDELPRHPHSCMRQDWKGCCCSSSSGCSSKLAPDCAVSGLFLLAGVVSPSSSHGNPTVLATGPRMVYGAVPACP
jgi:hypothetical protein